ILAKPLPRQPLGGLDLGQTPLAQGLEETPAEFEEADHPLGILGVGTGRVLDPLEFLLAPGGLLLLELALGHPGAGHAGDPGRRIRTAGGLWRLLPSASAAPRRGPCCRRRAAGCPSAAPGPAGLSPPST